MSNRLNTFGFSRLAEFGPDALPRLLTEHLPGDNPIGLHFNAPCFSGVHVTSSCQALIEVLLMHASFYSEAPALPRGDFYVHTPYLSDSLAYGQAIRTKQTARNTAMETNAERRRRKLAELCATHSVRAVAFRSNLSPASLDQIIKKVLLPPKKDGSRTARSLGDEAARRIEDAEGLGRGWFDEADQFPAPNTEPSASGAATLAQALEVVLDTLANSPAKAELKQLLPMLVDTNAPAYRARLHELLARPVAPLPGAESKDFHPPVPASLFDKTQQPS